MKLKLGIFASSLSAGGNGGGEPYNDASTWTGGIISNFQLVSDDSYQATVDSVAYGDGIWLIGGSNRDMRTSTDAITWTTVTSNFQNIGGYNASWWQRIFSISYNNNLWVAGGDGSYSDNQIRTSTNGSTWTTVNSNFGIGQIYSIAYGNNLWVAGGYYGKMITSTNGSTWTTVNSNFGNTGIKSIAYGNNLWVAGGYRGQMRTSTNGSTWTTVTSNFPLAFEGMINSIAYGNNLWVAGGLYGQIRTSTNGSTWTTVNSNFGNTGINSIAYGNNLWVAGGDNGQMRTSTDATTWTTVDPMVWENDLGVYGIVTANIMSLGYNNGTWVAGLSHISLSGATQESSSVSLLSVSFPE